MEERAALGLRAGDTVRVWQKIVEIKIGKAANKKAVSTKNVRRQAFEGLVLAVAIALGALGVFRIRNRLELFQ